MDHQDIVELVEAGNISAAQDLFAARKAKGGVSGHDDQALIAIIAGFQPPPVSETRDSKTTTRERVELEEAVAST